MSIESAIERVAALKAALADPALLAESQASSGAASGGTEAPSEASSGTQGSFAAALEQAGIERAGLEEGAPASPAQPGLPLSGAGVAGAAPSGALPASMYAVAGQPPGSIGASPSALGVAGPSGALSAPGVSGVGGAPALGAPGDVGARIVAIAESQAGQHEEPMASNEGSAIAMYRSATSGAMPGEPWCAYFASWVARQAGEPLGSGGQGLGSVGEIWSWAQSTGRAIPNGPGVVPKPGDLIVFGDEHVGIVRGVLPDGKIATIEGNYENKVALNERSASEPTGYVEMS